MQIAEMKYKHASQICIADNSFINSYFIVTRFLKINVSLNNKILNNKENFRTYFKNYVFYFSLKQGTK